MSNKLMLIYFLPLFFAALLALPFRYGEKTITRISTVALLFPALASLYLMLYAFSNGAIPFEAQLASVSLFGHKFPFIVWLDGHSFALLSLTHILGLLVVKFSHGYLHLEKGYQRFFSTILFFIFGMYLIALAGTLDLFFAGWEIVGFSSFLLIAFYRSHTRSVQNAWRIYNIYRICDVGLLLGAVFGHYLWHEATRFSVLLHLSESDFSGVNSLTMSLISFFLICASLGKSAQFPFYNWPARAMEGPTPSSAIFYGALSIHAGIFLLMRTHTVWSHDLTPRIIVGLIGLITMILSHIQGKVQANIKGQIAYASTTQLGLMFIELSFGFLDLAMFHLFTHALYRCFQMLASPSIVLNSLSSNNEVVMAKLTKKRPVNGTLYLLAISDFFLDLSWRGFHFVPWKQTYKGAVKVLNHPLIMLQLIAITVFLLNRPLFWPMTLSAFGFYFAFRSLLLHMNSFRVLLEMGLSLVLAMVAIYLVDSNYLVSIWSYCMSVVPCLLLVIYIGKKFAHYDLRNFHALGTLNPLHANIFFICFMVISGLPVSTAFMGEDILLEGLLDHSKTMTAFTALSLMIYGLVLVKVYTRLFMGRATIEN